MTSYNLEKPFTGSLITPKQITKLHALLTESRMMDNKQALVREVTNGRATSSKELTSSEVTVLINYLEDILGKDKLRGKIFALAYAAGIIYGDTVDDKKMNSAKLNSFLLQRGTVKKEIGKMDKHELMKTVNQFAAIVKHNEQGKQNKVVNSLLNELNLNVK